MIPKTFNLMGHTVKVSIVPERTWADDETVGFWNSQNSTISVLGGLGDKKTQQIFCHELVHAILSNMAEEELNGNERFVDVFGSLLHQAWTSIK